MGKDNKRAEMVPVIVHMERYVISKEQKKKWGLNRHACNVQDDPSVTEKVDGAGDGDALEDPTEMGEVDWYMPKSAL